MIAGNWAYEQNSARKEKYCVICGKLIPGANRQQKYCSPEPYQWRSDCRMKATHAEKEGRKHAPTKRKV